MRREQLILSLQKELNVSSEERSSLMMQMADDSTFKRVR